MAGWEGGGGVKAIIRLTNTVCIPYKAGVPGKFRNPSLPMTTPTHKRQTLGSSMNKQSLLVHKLMLLLLLGGGGGWDWGLGVGVGGVIDRS